LRGAIFESFVMAELLKYHYNRGIPDALYFYRDRDGREIVFIIETAAGLILIEAKSAATFNLRFIENMDWLERASGAVIRKAVVQGSDTEIFTHKEALIGGWRSVSPLVAKLTAP
jgi:predicted AAA+ superfamily ATPase